MGFDINNFPTKVSAKRMLSRITGIYGKSYVGKWIFEVMGAEIDPAWERVKELRLQASPVTATWGLKYWEQRYGIETDLTLSLEERRKRIIERRMPRLPINPARLEAMLSEICGRDVAIKENIAPYTFGIYIESSGNNNSVVDMNRLFALLNKVKPAHQRYRMSFVQNIGIYIATGTTAHKVHYIQAGTRPGISTGWRIGRRIIEVLTGTRAYQTIFPDTSDKTVSGTHPKQSIGWRIKRGNLEITPELKANSEIFPETSEELRTGSIPKQSQQYALDMTEVEIDKTFTPMASIYKQAGLLPKQSRQLAIDDEKLQIEADTEKFTELFHEATENMEAGSYPGQSSGYAVKESELLVLPEQDALKVVSVESGNVEAGTIPKTSGELSTDNGSVIHEVECRQYETEYPVCGDQFRI